MLFLIIALVAQDIVADKLDGQWYENETGISLNCKGYDLRDCTSKVKCAVVAANEAIYDFGFVVQDKACMVCRAGGTLEDADVLEIYVTGPLFVDGKAFKCDVLHLWHAK